MEKFLSGDVWKKLKKEIAKKEHLEYIKMRKELLELNKIHGVTVDVITKGE